MEGHGTAAAKGWLTSGTSREAWLWRRVGLPIEPTVLPEEWDGRERYYIVCICQVALSPEGGPRLCWRGVAVPDGKALNHHGKRAWFSGGELSLALEMSGLEPSCLSTASHVRPTWRTVCSKVSLTPVEGT